MIENNWVNLALNTILKSEVGSNLPENIYELLPLPFIRNGIQYVIFGFSIIDQPNSQKLEQKIYEPHLKCLVRYPDFIFNWEEIDSQYYNTKIEKIKISTLYSKNTNEESNTSFNAFHRHIFTLKLSRYNDNLSLVLKNHWLSSNETRSNEQKQVAYNLLNYFQGVPISIQKYFNIEGELLWKWIKETIEL